MIMKFKNFINMLKLKINGLQLGADFFRACKIDTRFLFSFHVLSFWTHMFSLLIAYSSIPLNKIMYYVNNVWGNKVLLLYLEKRKKTKTCKFRKSHHDYLHSIRKEYCMYILTKCISKILTTTVQFFSFINEMYSRIRVHTYKKV